MHTQQIYSDFGQLTSDYTLYADNGTTMWVSFYNYNTGCESYRNSYTFSISPSAYVYQDYAKQCRYEPAKIQLSSNVSGVTFQLYKLYEYYDPWYGWVQDYQFEQSNSTGYFEIQGFDPANDHNKYFAKVYQPYGCSMPYYYQLWFDITEVSPPVITGNLSATVGSGTTLFASGRASNFNWYDAGNNLLHQSFNYTTPSNLTHGTYVYQVRGVSADGTCLSDVASVTVSVNLPSVTYTSLFTSSNFSKTIDLSKPVGTVAGGGGTTATGGASYSIPVYTLPGTNGMQPSVAIAYNSQGGNGNVGHGWNIGGLSVISRAGKNIYHDGVVKPLSYTDQDAFVLDGMRLNPISGLNGANGTIYAGEMETFSKIVSNTSSSPNNPDWFKVTAKDGTVMEFGNSTTSRILTDNGQNVMLWRLSKIIDVNGNYIEFKYDNAFRDTRIDEINYTGNTNTGLLPYNKVKFNYEVRADAVTNYDAGASLMSKHLLKNIVITNEAATVKTYQFNYGFDNVASLLKEVVESGNDGTSLNSTIFLYGDQPANISVSSTTAFTQNNIDFYSGDFNADGKTDLLAAEFYFEVNDPTKYHSHHDLLDDITTGSSSLLYSQTLPSNSSVAADDRKIQSFLTSDYNKDGRDDVLLISTSGTHFSKININYTGSHNSSTGFTNYSTSPDFGIPYFSSMPYSTIHRQKRNFFIPGDFDGDGNQDYILILGNVRYSILGVTEFKAFLSSPATNEINREVINFGFGANPDPQYYAATVAGADMINTFDIDGDGKTEVLVTKDYQSFVLSVRRSYIAFPNFEATVLCSTYEITKDSKIFPGDFNGDRKTDWLVRNANGTWKILYSTGNGFVSLPFSFNQGVNIADHKVLIADFNGDGKSDILHAYQTSFNPSNPASKLSLYYSTGGVNAFYYEQHDYANGLNKMVVGDFNGDGRNDIFSRGYIHRPSDFISFRPLGKERLLSKVTDGHNTTIEFQYKNLTDKETYPYFYDRTVSLDDPSNSNPYNYVQLPLYAVSSMISPNGIGGTNTITYNYENAVVHRTGKGFLGFKKITAKDLTAGITSITENEINTQFAVPYNTKQSTSLTSNGEVLSETLITTSFDNLSATHKRFLQKTDKVLSINYLAGSASEVNNTYDAYGNVTNSISKIGTVSGTTVTPIETITTTVAFSIHNTPVPAKPDNITISKSRAGSANLSSTTQFTYNTLGLLATQVGYSGLPKAVTTSHIYNNFGNLTNTTVSASGVNSLVTSLSYDTKGRFIISKEVGAGTSISQTETTVCDSKWGKPLSITSSDCQTTTFQYDGYGRLKRTTTPLFTVSNSLVWDVQGQNVFYSYTNYDGGRPDVKTWMDKIGRVTKQQTTGFNGQWLTQLSTYNSKGNVATQTNAYYPNESPIVTTNTYDIYNRLKSTATPLNTVTHTYNKLSGGKMQVVTNDATGQSGSKTTDAAGRVVESNDKGGTLYFTYDSRGAQTEVKHGSTVIVTTIYDPYGRQTSLTDKNAGTITYNYDAFGRLEQQTDNSGTTYTMTYDDLGRLLTRNGPEGTTSYEYNPNPVTGCRGTKLTMVTGFNGVVKKYDYNGLNQLEKEIWTVDGTNYETQYMYGQFGHLTNTIYPSGIEVINTYDDENGLLLTVDGGRQGNAINLFTANEMNSFGQYTNYTFGNGKTSEHSYDLGFPTRFYTDNVQDLSFEFDMTRGNLGARIDNLKGLQEGFEYDDLNRLITSSVNGGAGIALTYDGNSSFSMGNIIAKTDAGDYVYNNNKIHAVEYITNPAGNIPPIAISDKKQTITYTPFLKAETIDEDGGDRLLNYTYGPEYHRVKSEMHLGYTGYNETKYYIGNYEIQHTHNEQREIHYVNGGDGLCAMIVRENGGPEEFYFVYKDHLGSILTVTDINANIIAEQNFDAWGRKRNPDDWNDYTNVPQVPEWLYRGYTGHEHLDAFGLINMNARLYDPIQGRMLGPDNYVPTPFGTQGYNRYAYAMNNPLSYVDPDGNFVWFIVGGAILGSYVGASMQQGSFNPGNWESGWWKGAITGALVGAGAGALVASMMPVTAGGIFANGTTAAGGITKSWGITTGILTSANVNIAFNALSGGGWDGAWKAGLAGAATGAWVGTGGMGLAKKGLMGSKLAGKLAYQAIGTSMRSIGSNWAGGSNILSRVDVGIGPLTFTLGKRERLFQFGPNAGSLIANGLGVMNTAFFGGDWKWNKENLGIDYIGGLYDKINFGSTGAYAVGLHSGQLNQEGLTLIAHEYTHTWDSRVLGNLFLPNYYTNFLFSIFQGGHNVLGYPNLYYNHYYEYKAFTDPY